MSKPSINLGSKNIAIVTHRSLLPCIPGDDLRQFVLGRKCSKLIYITHPLLYLKESYQLSSKCEYYDKSKLVQVSSAHHWVFPEPLLYIKDFFYTIYWILKTRQTYNVYLGINDLNALAGLLLKKLGRVKKVIYYTIDLFPQRFENKLINWIYHKVDKIAVRFCDETWNVSPFIAKYRAKKGMTGEGYLRQFTIPIGIWFSKMKRLPPSKVKKTKIVYVGHLTSFMGVDLAVRGIPLIRKKIPHIKLEIIGGGDELENLKQLADKLAVTAHIKFHWWKEKKEAEALIANAAIGLAPFNTLIIDEKIKNADPAKIKDYLALGLPIVMTNATLNAQTIAKLRCGIVIDYTPQSLANAVIKLLTDEKLWKEYRKNALQYVKQFDWNNLFTKNISRLLRKNRNAL